MEFSIYSNHTKCAYKQPYAHYKNEYNRISINTQERIERRRRKKKPFEKIKTNNK